MFNLTKRYLVSTILTLGLGAAALTAQTLDGSVVRDARTDAVTYTIDLDGPPRGAALLFVSPLLNATPIPLPGIGGLYLNPMFVFPIATVRLDAKGKGRWQMAIPTKFVDNKTFYFQGLMNDRGILRTTKNWCSSHLFEALVDDSLTVGMMHNSQTQTYWGEMRGRAGATVEIVHYRGGQIDIWRGKIPANGILPVRFTYKNKLKHGDVIVIRYNNKVFKSWRR
jgi:hypothetical protein